MQISQVSRARPGGVNEDYACAGTGWALLLDGATPVAGARTGCVHDVPWLVRQLAAALSARLIGNREATLAGLLSEAIEQARAAHAGSCDLANPDSPSSTVSMVRLRGDDLEYLVLADSPVVLCGRDGHCRVIVDDRIAQLPGGQPYDAALVRASRNCAGGFWVASTSPDAARHAITGTVPVLELAAAGCSATASAGWRTGTATAGAGSSACCGQQGLATSSRCCGQQKEATRCLTTSSMTTRLPSTFGCGTGHERAGRCRR